MKVKKDEMRMGLGVEEMDTGDDFLSFCVCICLCTCLGLCICLTNGDEMRMGLGGEEMDTGGEGGVVPSLDKTFARSAPLPPLLLASFFPLFN